MVSLWGRKLPAKQKIHGREFSVSEPLAHSGGHLLVDHLKRVAELAAEFSKAFDAVDASRRWAYLAGLWHDLGKYRPGFQRYLRPLGKKNWSCNVQ